MSKTEEDAKPTRNPKASGGASAQVEVSVVCRACAARGHDMTPPVGTLGQDYMVAHVREPEVCRRLRAHTLEKLGSRAIMQITADQGQFFTWLLQVRRGFAAQGVLRPRLTRDPRADRAQTLGAKTCVEVGVFTGYSALCTALALPDDGKLYALDISEECVETPTRMVKHPRTRLTVVPGHRFTSLAKPFWKEAGVDSKIGACIADGAVPSRDAC